jgi:hypothetical protein
MAATAFAPHRTRLIGRLPIFRSLALFSLGYIGLTCPASAPWLDEDSLKPGLSATIASLLAGMSHLFSEVREGVPQISPYFCMSWRLMLC